jgi:predicted transcriptional regulator
MKRESEANEVIEVKVRLKPELVEFLDQEGKRLNRSRTFMLNELVAKRKREFERNQRAKRGGAC